MESAPRKVRVHRRIEGSRERFALEELGSGRVVTLRADLSPGWNDVFPPRHESLTAIASAAGWRVESVLFRWTGELAASVTLACPEGGRMSIAAWPGTACRLGLACSCEVLIEEAALAELAARGAA